MKIRGQTVYPLKERLERLSKPAASGCIEWTGRTEKGYGKLIIGSRSNGTRRTISAHRLAYEVHVGAIPKGLEVCHSCDNPPCVNPEHLFIGTRQDNIDDREAKGRNRTHFPLYGEAHPRAKLNWDAVKIIRSSSCRLSDDDAAQCSGLVAEPSAMPADIKPGRKSYLIRQSHETDSLLGPTNQGRY